MLKSVYGIYIFGLIAGIFLMNAMNSYGQSNNGILYLVLAGGYIIGSFLMLSQIKKGNK